jgi:hypothetical protein
MVAITFLTGVVLVLQWCTLRETNRLAAIDQRPYVATTEIQVNDAALTGYLMFDVFVANSGGTPTRDMQYMALRSLAPPNNPETAFTNPPDAFSQVDRGLIAPGAKIPLRLGDSVGLLPSVRDEILL